MLLRSAPGGNGDGISTSAATTGWEELLTSSDGGVEGTRPADLDVRGVCFLFFGPPLRDLDLLPPPELLETPLDGEASREPGEEARDVPALLGPAEFLPEAFDFDTVLLEGTGRRSAGPSSLP